MRLLDGRSERTVSVNELEHLCVSARDVLAFSRERRDKRFRHAWVMTRPGFHTSGELRSCRQFLCCCRFNATMLQSVGSFSYSPTFCNNETSLA